MSDLSERLSVRPTGLEEAGEEGFTLIELLVVLLIIGILLAIAIPTFLSVTKTANNTAAQANLQTALTGADTYYTSNNQTYTGLYAGGTGVSGITAIDTGLTYVTNATTNKSNTISLLSGGSGTWLIMAAFAPGTKDCWLIVDLKSSVTTAFTTGLPSTDWAAGTYYAVIRNDTGVCSANLTENPTAWSSTGFPHG
jgi:type IV pilus assembly protein PilA